MYTQTEKVNIEPKSYLPVFRISQNDVGRTLKAHLVSDEGTIAIPTSATVTMAGTKPSGLGYTATGTIDGSDVTFETDATMTDEAGQIQSEIRIVVGETLIGTTNVILNVEPNPHPSDTTDGQREPLVNEITALLNQITAQADRVEEYSSKVLNMTVSAHESEEPTVTKTEGEVVNLDFGLPRGAKGERGERGEQGEAGKDGKDGIDGKDGKDGINGVTPDFSIGTVTTLEPNESASVTLTGTEEEPVLNFGIPKGAKGEQGDVSLSDLEKIMVTDTASGAIASFPDGSDLLPALSLVANIIPKQSGTGTPSPENIRPISGWESVVLTDAGKNLVNWTITESTFATSYNGFGQGKWQDRIEMPSAWYGKTLTYSAYIVAGSSASNQCVRVWFYKDGTYVPVYQSGNPIVANQSGTSAITITVPNDGTVNQIGLGVSANDATFSNPQIEIGTTATAYEPYTATTNTTSLGRTVYGGTIDLVSGVLTVDRALVDLGTLDYSHSSSWNAFVTNLSDAKRAFNKAANAISSLYTSVEGHYASDTQANMTMAINTNSHNDGVCTFRNTAYTDATAFKTAMNGVQLCYELATPTTYQLTPQQINTLSGVNNVWADSGDVTIEYYADTKLYIDKKLGGN